ncbi:MAG TPA: RnfH family protein [Gammaproteobacteria bacterium]|nr:RnfH family protein [Gammaproteobacteria bacterium]
MENAESIPVEVAYAKPEEQVILKLDVTPGTSLRQAIEQSGILERFPEIDLEKAKVGIFGKLKKPDQVLQPGDRVEIYRPLIADPKKVRKERAAAGKRMKKGGGSLQETP